MARPVPSAFVPIKPNQYGPNHPIKEGSSGAHVGALDLAENIHFCWVDAVRPVTISNLWSQANNGWVVAHSSMRLIGVWRREPTREPFVSYDVTVLYQNSGTTSPGDDGTLRVDIASDPYSGGSGTFVDITLSATLGAIAGSDWVMGTGSLLVDPSQSIETFRAWAVSGSTGAARVGSITIQPRPVSSIPAGVETPADGNSHRFVPFDAAELDADSPWSVHAVNTMIANCETIRKTRPATIISYACDPSDAARAGWQSDSAAYTLIARIPFRSGHGETAIRWSIVGKRDGSSGAVRMTTTHMSSKETAAQEVALGATWSSPYTAGISDYTGGAALTCAENSTDEIRIWIKGDGSSDAYIYGLCAWFAPVA